MGPVRPYRILTSFHWNPDLARQDPTSTDDALSHTGVPWIRIHTGPTASPRAPPGRLETLRHPDGTVGCCLKGATALGGLQFLLAQLWLPVIWKLGCSCRGRKQRPGRRAARVAGSAAAVAGATAARQASVHDLDLRSAAHTHPSAQFRAAARCGVSVDQRSDSLI